MKNRIYNELPSVIKNILLITEGWLVGNSALDILKDKEPKDYDIIVPSREMYSKMVTLLASQYDYDVNSYGGLKFNLDEFDIKLDIWCEELDHFILNAKDISYLYNFKRNYLFKKE